VCLAQKAPRRGESRCAQIGSGGVVCDGLFDGSVGIRLPDQAAAKVIRCLKTRWVILEIAIDKLSKSLTNLHHENYKLQSKVLQPSPP
jgi:hypothetical protein